MYFSYLNIALILRSDTARDADNSKSMNGTKHAYYTSVLLRYMKKVVHPYLSDTFLLQVENGCFQNRSFSLEEKGSKSCGSVRAQVYVGYIEVQHGCMCRSKPALVVETHIRRRHVDLSGLINSTCFWSHIHIVNSIIIWYFLQYILYIIVLHSWLCSYKPIQKISLTRSSTTCSSYL